MKLEHNQNNENTTVASTKFLSIYESTNKAYDFLLTQKENLLCLYYTVLSLEGRSKPATLTWLIIRSATCEL